MRNRRKQQFHCDRGQRNRFLEVPINALIRDILLLSVKYQKTPFGELYIKINIILIKYQLLHLYETDYDRSLEYCNWFLQKYLEDHTLRGERGVAAGVLAFYSHCGILFKENN